MSQNIVKGGVAIGLAVGGGPVGVAIAAIGLGVEIGKTIAKTQETRELFQEKKALDTHQACNSIQNDLIKAHPELEKLVKPKAVEVWIGGESGKQNQICMQSGQYKTLSKDEIKTDIARNFAVDKVKEKGIDALKEAITSIVENPTPTGMVVGAIKTAVNIKGEYEEAIKRNKVKKEINEVNKHLMKEGIPPYAKSKDGLEALKESARDKTIDTAALVKITENKKAFEDIKDNPEKLKIAFDNAKISVAKNIRGVDHDNIVVEVVKDAGRSITPASKYSKDVEFTTKDEMKEKFMKDGFNSEKTSGEKFKEALQMPEYKPKDSKFAEKLANKVENIDKSMQNEDPYAVNLKHFQKETKTTEHNIETRPRSNAVDYGKKQSEKVNSR